MFKVSVVIPVYGVEKYIEKCARSLFEQTLDSIEFIFIDDCTPDNSIEILALIIDEYTNRIKDKNWKVRIERLPTNSGLPAVRRQGIQLATGEYIIHCDSDDYVDSKMYETMYTKADEQNADIVICDYYAEDGSKEIYRKSVSEKVLSIEDYKVGVITRDVHCSTFTKLIKKELYNKEILYPQDNYGEDSALVTQLIYYATKIVYLPQAFYHYRYNPTSISKKKGIDAQIKAFSQTCNNASLIEKFYKTRKKNERIDKAIMYLKCMERDRILKLTSQTKYYKMWINAFPEINLKLLFNPIVPYKIKMRHIVGLLRLYPIFDKWFH